MNTSMRRFLTQMAYGICLLFMYSCVALGQCSSSHLPEQLQRKLAEYKEWKMVDVGSLTRDDQRTWQNEHPKECPGLTEGRFIDEQPSFVIALVRRSGNKLFQQVLAFRPGDVTYEPIPLGVPSEVAIVHMLIKLPPGKYMNFERDVTIRTLRDVVALTQINAHSTLYYWRNGEFHSLNYSE